MTMMQSLSRAVGVADQFQDRMIKQYTDRIKAARAVDTKQGNLEPVVGTVRFTTDGAGAIAAGTFRTFFLDELGQNANSGIVQTRADGTFFGGKIPSGTMFILFGMGFQIEAPPALTAADIQTLTAATSVLVNLRQAEVRSGSLRDWPSIVGPRGVGNGNLTDGFKPLEPALVLEPLQDYTIRLTVERQVTLSQANTNYDVHVSHPNVRIYDPLVLGKS